jgi:hypothetical protein
MLDTGTIQVPGMGAEIGSNVANSAYTARDREGGIAGPGDQPAPGSDVQQRPDAGVPSGMRDAAAQTGAVRAAFSPGQGRVRAAGIEAALCAETRGIPRRWCSISTPSPAAPAGTGDALGSLSRVRAHG